MTDRIQDLLIKIEDLRRKREFLGKMIAVSFVVFCGAVAGLIFMWR